MFHVGSIPCIPISFPRQINKLEIEQSLKRTGSQTRLTHLKPMSSFSYSSDSDTSFKYDDGTEIQITENDLESQIITSFERETELAF